MITENKTKTYRNMALKLLDLYYGSELTAIGEYGINIREEEKELKEYISECARTLDCSEEEYNRIVEKYDL